MLSNSFYFLGLPFTSLIIPRSLSFPDNLFICFFRIALSSLISLVNARHSFRLFFYLLVTSLHPPPFKLIYVAVVIFALNPPAKYKGVLGFRPAEFRAILDKV